MTHGRQLNSMEMEGHFLKGQKEDPSSYMTQDLYVHLLWPKDTMAYGVAKHNPKQNDNQKW